MRALLAGICLGLLLAGASLAEQQPTASLQGTEWKLLKLGKRGIPHQEGRRRDPYLVFDAHDGRVKGFAGCNHVQGDYELEGERLRIGTLASTRMACSTGFELETYFLRTLEQVGGWRIDDGRLELLDGEGKRLALFEAVQR